MPRNSPATDALSWPTRWRHRLGLAQSRCAQCLRPFTPPAEEAGPSPEPDIAGPAAPLCPACRLLLAPHAGPRCPRCARPAQDRGHGAGPAGLCGGCLQNPPPWDSIACHGLYSGALRHALLRLKFDGHLYLAPLLGAFLLEAARCLPRPDALTAVPQHVDHLRHRGYNQAHEIAKALHALSGLPLVPGLLSRPVPGPAQAGLAAVQRRSNVLHSFAAAPRVRGLRVWIVDDVMTTGSTLGAAARALRAAGAARVDLLFVARTPRDG